MTDITIPIKKVILFMFIIDIFWQLFCKVRSVRGFFSFFLAVLFVLQERGRGERFLLLVFLGTELEEVAGGSGDAGT
jgi:hypothetical protein